MNAARVAKRGTMARRINKRWGYLSKNTRKVNEKASSLWALGE